MSNEIFYKRTIRMTLPGAYRFFWRKKGYLCGNYS